MVLIVGAGITGLSIAYLLARSGIKVLVLEKEKQVGGLARSFRYGDFTFDIGPHRFYTHNREVLAFIREVLGGEEITLERRTAVYFRNHYYTWPLHSRAVFKLPPSLTLRTIRDVIGAHFKSKDQQRNFRDYIIRHYGPTLYEVFFREYTRKFLGIPPEETHYAWAQIGIVKAAIDDQIAPRSLGALMKSSFFTPQDSLKFIYPRRMMGSFCEILAAKIRELGGEILVSQPVERLQLAQRKIKTIFAQGQNWSPERVIWTAPLTTLCSLLGISARGLEYRSMVLYLLEINRPSRLPYQWCYYGDPNILFSRVSQPTHFNIAAAPEGRSGLCLEILCQKGDDYWENYLGLKDKVITDLMKVGLIGEEKEIMDFHHQRIPEAYPIYHVNYTQGLDQIRNNLGQINNLIIAGRSGSFWYNNMDECIETAAKIASGIIRSGS
jgi:protoporphyrinogen oxidase